MTYDRKDISLPNMGSNSHEELQNFAALGRDLAAAAVHHAWEYAAIEQQVFEALHAAGDIQSFRELNAIISPVADSLGFPEFVCVECPPPLSPPHVSVLFGEPDMGWLDDYNALHLADIDPRVRHSLKSATPIVLTDIDRPTDEPTARFLSAFHAHGKSDSFVWPVHLPEGRVRAVVMTKRGGTVDADARVAAGVLASGFHAAGSRLLDDQQGADTTVSLLRPRHIECLFWAKQGKSSSVTGRILGLSARTVDEHLGNACALLDVRTRIQAVAKAVALGIL